MTQNYSRISCCPTTTLLSTASPQPPSAVLMTGRHTQNLQLFSAGYLVSFCRIVTPTSWGNCLSWTTPHSTRSFLEMKPSHIIMMLFLLSFPGWSQSETKNDLGLLLGGGFFRNAAQSQESPSTSARVPPSLPIMLGASRAVIHRSRSSFPSWPSLATA